MQLPRKSVKYQTLMMLTVLIYLFISCNKDTSVTIPVTPPPVENLKNYTYLALGDSYMASNPSGFGTRSSFPFKLTDTLKKEGFKVEETVLAQFGWTTSDLFSEMLKLFPVKKKFDLITLCIGVNNNYRKMDTAIYRQEFRNILNVCLAQLAEQPKNIFILSIPDWGATEFAKNNDRTPEQIATEINAFNAINKEEAVKAKVNYVDITTISREVRFDNSLSSSDKLHPSEKMHNKWVEVVYPAVLPVFE